MGDRFVDINKSCGPLYKYIAYPFPFPLPIQQLGNNLDITHIYCEALKFKIVSGIQLK
jgi:hypothetical protein